MNTQEGLDALFLHATEGILVTNSKGEIIRINPSGANMFGYAENELLGKKVEALVPQKIAERHVHNREGFSKNPNPRRMGIGMNLAGRKKDGTEFPVEVSLSPYNRDGEQCVIAFIIDITVRKSVEDEIFKKKEELQQSAQRLQESNTKLEQFAEELEKRVERRTAELAEAKEDLIKALTKEKELNTLKSRFVSMASHEFRTPLGTILSSVSLIDQYNKPEQEEKRHKHIERIKSMVKNLTDILNDFLSIDKLDEGKVNADPDLFDLTALSKEVTEAVQMSAKAGQKISYRHSGNKKEVFLDKKIMRNVITNLLNNAVKYSPENKPIEFSTGVTKKEILISVKDNGIGIPEKDRPHMFDRFFRAGNVTNIQGTGLGLNIVKRYVELMGGTISFISEIEKGTTFTVKFPL
jgi:PAS domain S-box-containing protein